MRIGLIVDHPKRDLEGAVRLAYALAKGGAEALIIPMYYQGVDVPCLGLDAVVANFARPANRALIAQYARAGIAVFVLDTEGGVLADRGGNSPSVLAQRMKDEGYGAHLAGYFFWGPVLRDAFAAAGVLPPERLHVTGCPRFDYAASPWRSMLDRDQRGYVLVNANFPLVNPLFSGSAGRERTAMIDAGWDPAYVDRLLGDLRTVFARYLETVREAARQRPRLTFLVRPHPFERATPYIETFAGLANVRVSGEGNVLQVIHNSAAVFHLNCGTAVEAVMLGKLPVQMDFLNTDATAGHAKLPGMVSHRVASHEELLSVLDDIDGTAACFPFETIYRDNILPFFFVNDGCAGQRVAEILLGRKGSAGQGKPWRSVTASLAGSRPHPTLGQVANGVVSVVLGSAATATVRSWIKPARRDKMFSVDEVQAILDRLGVLDPKGGRITVRRDHGGLLHRPLASLHVGAA